MAEEHEQRSFWQTLPGILTAVAGVITAVTGLLLAFGQLGLVGGDGRGAPDEPMQTTVPEGGAITADPIAGSWAGEATQGGDGEFDVVVEIKEGCGLDERCGWIYVSNTPCRGDIYLHDYSPARYEFAVENFSPESSEACIPGAGEYLTPQDDGTILYTTGYDPQIRGTLRRVGD